MIIFKIKNISFNSLQNFTVVHYQLYDDADFYDVFNSPLAYVYEWCQQWLPQNVIWTRNTPANHVRESYHPCRHYLRKGQRKSQNTQGRIFVAR